MARRDRRYENLRRRLHRMLKLTLEHRGTHELYYRGSLGSLCKGPVGCIMCGRYEGRTQILEELIREFGGRV